MHGRSRIGLRDLAEGAVALARSGALRPHLPTPSLLALLLEVPFSRPNLGHAVAFQARTQGTGVAIIDDAGMLTWSELDRRVSRLANVLLRHGEPGGCLAFMVRNGREAIECYAAGGRAGMAPAPLNTFLTAPELAKILHMQRPAVLVVDAELAEVADKALRDLDDAPLVLVVHRDPPRTRAGRCHTSYEGALATVSSSAPLVRGTGRVVMHTSGTTGAPKGAEREVGSSGLGAMLGFVSRIPLRRDDRVYIAPPLFHGFASGVAVAAILLGATMVLPRRFDAAAFEPEVRRYRCTAAALVPIMLRRCLEQQRHLSGAAGAGLAESASECPLRMVITSGSALPRALRDDAQARWGEIVYDLYGSTEAGWVAIAGPEDHRARPGTVGRPGPGMRVDIVDDEGTPVVPGTVGRLRVTTGIEFRGYTGSDVHHGAWDIGDLGYADADGYLYITGRRDDLVISGGENVYPSEVEEHLEAHPLLREAAVIGVPHAEYGQVLWAYVAGDAAPEDVVAFLRERLAAFKVPKRVVVVDALPRNATGKVLKRRLPSLEHPSRGRAR